MLPLPDLTALSASDIATIRDISQATWNFIPQKFKEVIENKVGSYAESKWASVIWSQQAEIYFTNLFARVATTRLLGHPKEIRLNDIFTDVYLYNTPLSTKLQHPKSLDAATLKQKRQDDEAQRVPADQILKEKRIFLTGKPGAGKTTLLRHLVIKSIATDSKTTPIYVQLKDITDNARHGKEIDLLGHIEQQFKIVNLPKITDFLEHLFASGRTTLMLDGLDEVTERKGIRHELVSQILKLATQYPKIRVILTCRVGADTFTFEQFATAQIADFSPMQQIMFVKRWYAADQIALSSFLEAWSQPESAGLRDLASTPLLLALLCIGYDETREFPTRRGDLYKEAVEALLRRWSVSRGIERDNPFRKLTSSRKEQLLSFMAFRLFKAGHFIFSSHAACTVISEFIKSLPRREIDDGIEAVEVLRILESAHGLIVHETSDYLAFSHLTIHEYFTARYLIESTNEKTLRNLISFETITNRQWREVILLAAGSVTSSDYLLALIHEEIARILASEPNMRRILKNLCKEEEISPADVWGGWAANVTKIHAPHYAVGLQSITFSLERAMLAASVSPSITRRAHRFCKNLRGDHLKYAEIYLAEAPESRRTKFLNVIYAEELYANALSVGTVSNRPQFENLLLRYE